MIGTGSRGGSVLKEVLQQSGVKVVALCDIKPDRLDAAASSAARDKPDTFKDYRKLLERKDIDAVFIDTPCDLHVEMAIAALAANKHVYCEKPVGITPQSISHLLQAAKGSDRVFCVGQQMRSFKSVRETIKKLHDGIAGEIIMVKAQRHASWDLNHTGSSAEWFFDAKRSGDVIVEMAVHNLDLCNWAIGSRPERAAGFGGALLWKNDPPGRTNMDGYTLSYEYANGVKMSFTQNFFHPSGLPGGGQFTNIYGTKGAVSLDTFKFYPLEKGAQPVELSQPEKERDEPHLTGFFEAIRTGSKPPADLTIGATAALTAIMGREAIYTRKVVTWKDLGVQV
ncbi:MAG TPA: Gfo/Idh/MocA family oxidoreductase [Phyllobacterium sp.]|nr:Gfo/Idh/MocA family oxidoreductase [Phyllobacterium sp.]